MNLPKYITEKLPGKAITQVKGPDGKCLYITMHAHYMAWSIYAIIFYEQQTHERIAQRGGFGEEELNAFYPEWRNHIVS